MHLARQSTSSAAQASRHLVMAAWADDWALPAVAVLLTALGGAVEADWAEAKAAKTPTNRAAEKRMVAVWMGEVGEDIVD